MSGWIKLEKDRRDDPRVLRMARELRHAGALHERCLPNFYVTIVLGCLDQLWCYADSHLRDGDTLDLGVDEIDELVGLKGFCNLMPADWLEVLDSQSVKLPDFHSHNGTEAKKKAQGQKRQERKRNADALQEVTEESRKSVTSALPDQDQTKTNKDMAAERPSVRARFAEFWASYPKKVKRKDAEKVWQSKRLDGIADLLITDIKRRGAEDRRWLGGFVPDPPTYLRGERWNDALEPAVKNGAGLHAADAAAKERTQTLDLASMFGMEQGSDDWPTFKAKVDRVNARRLASLG